MSSSVAPVAACVSAGSAEVFSLVRMYRALPPECRRLAFAFVFDLAHPVPYTADVAGEPPQVSLRGSMPEAP